MTEDLPPSIPEYFSGKNIFITGGTGFVGKVLIEKLLRSCPGIGKIYMLIRSKKEKNPSDRLKAITDLPLYDVLKKECPERLNKIVLVVGDIVELGLGLNPETRKMLVEEVNIIYHIAASVRFDDPLRDAIIVNTRGTREVVQLAKEIKYLEVLFHLSTSYTNTDQKVIEEKIYPPHADWKKSIELAENVDRHVMDVLSTKYINPLPNTYTFTKSMAEHVVNDMCDGQIPAIIMRPSIVISTMSDPISGWIDNFNGPVGLLAATGKGILRSVYASPDIIADYVPCDILIRGIIISTWRKGTEKESAEKYKVSVYNACSSKVKPVTIGEIVHMGKKLIWEIQLSNMIWYPNCSVTGCWYINFFKIIFYQLLPALFLDGFLILAGKKPLLVKVTRKIFVANDAVSYFLTNEWEFKNEKAHALESYLLPCDQQAFSFQTDHELAEPYTFFREALKGGRRYLFHEPDSTIDRAKLHARRMWLIAQAFNSMFYLVAFLTLYYMILKIYVNSTYQDVYTYFSTY